MVNMDRKCKDVVLSTESKLTVLDSVAKGVGCSELCEKFGIGKLTITTLKKNEAKIREFAFSLESKSGQLWHFCNRHGIRGLRMQGEKLLADREAPEPFKKELQDVMECVGLALEQILMRQCYTIKCFLQKPSLPKLKEMHQV